MQTLADLLNTIPAIDPAAMSRAQRHIDGLLKPVGSLGRLEALAIQLAGMPGLNGIPHVGKKAVLVMCADHGVWEEGVAISPKEVTAIQAENMTRGTTGVCVLAAQAGANVYVIDVGIDTAEPIPGLINMRVARGSGNIASAPAMSRHQAENLLLDVICYTRELAKNGVTLFGVGELGMANTTPAAAIVSTITGRAPEEVVGIGANLPTDKLANKIDVVRRAITLNQPNPQDGVDVLFCFCLCYRAADALLLKVFVKGIEVLRPQFGEADVADCRIDPSEQVGIAFDGAAFFTAVLFQADDVAGIF